MTTGSTIVVIEDDDQQRNALKSVFEFADIKSVVFYDSSRWKEQPMASQEVLAVLLGRCTHVTLRQLAESLKAWDANIPLILLKDSDTTYEEGLAKQFFNILERPLRYQQLTHTLHQAQIYRDGKRQSPVYSRSPELFRSLVGSSRGINVVRQLIEQVADSEATVLILGESGTGKEVVARNLHYRSSRRDKPFVPINCGAIPPDLLESELFGHEKGAFTGAISTRKGRFELAEGGTLFLDEIGDMSMHMQVKLLRVLQERVFERVGSNKPMVADVRIMAATHQNLEEAIKNGKFREDLFYRLNVFPIEMPPLRERIEDVPLLINEIITRLEHEKRGSARFTAAAIGALCQYHWPGNIRELANLVERLVIMYPYGLVDVGDLPEKYRGGGAHGNAGVAGEATRNIVVQFDPLAAPRLPREGLDLKEHLNNLEYNLIKQALDDADGVVAHAANRLRLRRTTLVEKLRKYGLQRAETTP